MSYTLASPLLNSKALKPNRRRWAATTALALLCLCIIICMAHPKIRVRYHDLWEMSHRFAGWTAVGLIWAQTIVLTIAAAHHAGQSIGLVLLKTPTFWFLIVISCCVVYPWLRLRRRKVEAEVLSDHAVRLWFAEKEMKVVCRCEAFA